MPILLLDVYSLFYRAFHALPEMSTASGEPTSALYGFSTLVLKLVREEQPSSAAFVVDLPIPTFRHRAYAPYKQNRAPSPPALSAQLRRLPELLAGFGWPVHAAAGFEGDDVLATLASRLAAAGEAPLVVTGDHDCLQLAEAPTKVLIVSRSSVKAETYDAERVRAQYGVGPAQIPDWIALVGDPSDNLPGVPGVGGKTAVRWLEAHGDVAAIVAAADTLEPARLRRVVLERRELLPLWRDLATLRRDVPITLEPPTGPVEVTAGLRELFARLEFRSLLARLAAPAP